MANVPTYVVPEKNFSSVPRPALGQSKLAPSLRTLREPPAARDERGIDSGFVQAKTSASASRPATASFAASIGAPLMGQAMARSGSFQMIVRACSGAQ